MMTTTENLPVVGFGQIDLCKAIEAALSIIREHGAIEDLKLAELVTKAGNSEYHTGRALGRIIDNVQHKLWTEELGRLPISILDASAESGEESWAYVWIG